MLRKLSLVPTLLGLLMATTPHSTYAQQYTPAELCYYFNIGCNFDPPINDFNDDAPDVVQSNYYVRSGDLNGDGKVDFFVTGADVYRTVQNFLLMSNGGGYQVVLNLTSTQLSIVSNWAVSSLPVSRVDINMDGYFDFLLGEAVGGNDIAVITGNAGTTPIGAVVVDEGIRQAGREIANAILHPQDTLASYDYYDVHFDHWEYVWIPYPCYPDDWYFSCGWWEQYPVFVEVHGSDTFTPIAQRFISGNHAAIANGSLTTTFAEAAVQTGSRVVVAAGAGALAARIAILALRVAVTAAIIPEAPVIMVAALAAITAYGVYMAVSAVLSDVAPSDRGPLPSTTALPPDPFEPCNRTPRNPAAEARRNYPADISRDSASYDLKKNLNSRGCSKPNSLAEAHHIVPLNDNPGGTVGNQLRVILSENGVNINESSNGVWLPKNANVATNAMTHAEAQEQEVLQAVRERLLNAQASGGGRFYAGDAIRAELEQIGNEMATGNFHY
jgi:hypothetical protein